MSDQSVWECEVCGKEFDSQNAKNGHKAAGHGQPWRDKETLERLYVEQGMSSREVADELGCGMDAILEWLEDHGIESRPQGRHQTPNVSITLREGYETSMIREPDGVVTVKHHRMLAIAEYGLDAVAGKDVHHKNHIPWDNRPENLELVDHSEHMRYHERLQPRTKRGKWA